MRGLKEIRFCSLVEKKKRIVAKTNAVQAPRENVNTSAAPPNARTAAASHLYLRSTSTNSTLTATNSTSLRVRAKCATYRNTRYICNKKNNSKAESLASRATNKLKTLNPK